MERFSEYLAFLQKTIQSDKNLVPPPTPSMSAPFPAMNLLGAPHPAPTATVATPGTMPLGIMPPREMISVPDMRDTFGEQQLSGAGLSAIQQAPQQVPQQAPMAMGTIPSPPVNPPFRTAETPIRPALELVAPAHNTPAHNMLNSPQIPVGESSMPMVASSAPVPGTAALAMEEPLPGKMTVEVPLALEGFCPVTLSAEERWTSGNPAYCTMYKGHIFRFASWEALVAFAQNPANYIPVAMGEDIVLMVDRNKRVNGNREFGAWFKGRIFLFSSKATFDAFEARPEYYMEIALKYEMARKEQPVPILY
jgi:YHS domain-containing protein